MSNESDKIYNCQIIDKIDYEKLLRFKTATIKFYTQPYKYKKNENQVTVNITSQTSVTVNNIGLEPSKPIIKLTGSGTVDLKVNGSTIFTYTFPTNETEVVIDSLIEEAHLNGIYKNRNMVGAFPILQPGANTIGWSGTLTKIQIQPKSRWL